MIVYFVDDDDDDEFSRVTTPHKKRGSTHTPMVYKMVDYSGYRYKSFCCCWWLLYCCHTINRGNLSQFLGFSLEHMSLNMLTASYGK